MSRCIYRKNRIPQNELRSSHTILFIHSLFVFVYKHLVLPDTVLFNVILYQKVFTVQTAYVFMQIISAPSKFGSSFIQFNSIFKAYIEYNYSVFERCNVLSGIRHSWDARPPRPLKDSKVSVFSSVRSKNLPERDGNGGCYQGHNMHGLVLTNIPFTSHETYRHSD